MKPLIFFILLTAFSGTELVALVSAANAGIVPCSLTSQGGEPCGLCHLFELINNVFIFFLIPNGEINGGVPLVPTVAVLMILIGGFLFVAGSAGLAAGGDAISLAKRLFASVAIGVVIAYGAWLLVDSFLFIIGVKNFGVWHTLNCQI